MSFSRGSVAGPRRVRAPRPPGFQFLSSGDDAPWLGASVQPPLARQPQAPPPRRGSASWERAAPPRRGAAARVLSRHVEGVTPNTHLNTAVGAERRRLHHGRPRHHQFGRIVMRARGRQAMGRTAKELDSPCGPRRGSPWGAPVRPPPRGSRPASGAASPRRRRRRPSEPAPARISSGRPKPRPEIPIESALRLPSGRPSQRCAGTSLVRATPRAGARRRPCRGRGRGPCPDGRREPISRAAPAPRASAPRPAWSRLAACPAPEPSPRPGARFPTGEQP